MIRRSFIGVLNAVLVSYLVPGFALFKREPLMFFGHDLAASGRDRVEIVKDVNAVVEAGWQECGMGFAIRFPKTKYPMLNEQNTKTLAAQLASLERSLVYDSAPHTCQAAYDRLRVEAPRDIGYNAWLLQESGHAALNANEGPHA